MIRAYHFPRVESKNDIWTHTNLWPIWKYKFTVFLSDGINNGMLIQKYNSSRRGRDGRSTLEVRLK